MHRVHHEPLYRETQYRMFRSLVPGDIVFARMPLSDGTLYDIPEGHKDRPYLIVKKERDFCYAYPCTTKKNKSLHHANSYLLRKALYAGGDYQHRLNYDSYVNLTQRYKLPIQNLLHYRFHLRDNDKTEINRRLDCLRREHPFDDTIMGRVGDIWRKKQSYWYVYQTDRKILYVHPVVRTNCAHAIPIVTWRHGYYIDIGRTAAISSDEYQLIYICNEQFTQSVANQKEKYKKQQKQMSKKVKQSTNHHFLYSFGQVLRDRFSQERIVYLYSINQKNYGFWEAEADHGNLQIRNLGSLQYCQCEERGIYEDLADTVEYLISQNRDIHGVLREWKKFTVGG